MKIYDVIVVGGGLAGLSAGWVLNLHKVDFLIVVDEIGGKIVESPLVNLYPFVKMSGRQMIEWLLERIPEDKIIEDKIVKVKVDNSIRELLGESGKKYYARGIIFATGGIPKKFKFDVPYKTCVLCELPFLKGKRVMLVYDEPHYLSVIKALKRVCNNIGIEHTSRVKEISYDGTYKVNGKEYDELFYLSEPEPVVNIEGVPQVRPNHKFQIAPLVYLAGDVVPQKSFAIFAVASGIVSALNLIDELYVHKFLSTYYAQGKYEEMTSIPEITSREELEKVITSHDKVLIVWHSLFCAPCFVYENVLKKVIMENVIPVYLVSADKVGDKSIRAVPTSIYYERGKEVWRREGIIKYGELLKMLK